MGDEQAFMKKNSWRKSSFRVVGSWKSARRSARIRESREWPYNYNSENMIKQFDHLYKTVIIGNSGVGKSAILVRFVQNQFSEHYLATIGVDFRFKTIQVDAKNVKFQIWDTAGQERFRTITSAYYRGSQGILLVFDLTDPLSFENICKFWMNEV